MSWGCSFQNRGTKHIQAPPNFAYITIYLIYCERQHFLAAVYTRTRTYVYVHFRYTRLDHNKRRIPRIPSIPFFLQHALYRRNEKKNLSFFCIIIVLYIIIIILTRRNRLRRPFVSTNNSFPCRRHRRFPTAENAALVKPGPPTINTTNGDNNDETGTVADAATKSSSSSPSPPPPPPPDRRT